MRGGKRKGAGRKPSPSGLVKKSFKIRQDQDESLNALPKRTKGKFVRDAIDEKLARQKALIS